MWKSARSVKRKRYQVQRFLRDFAIKRPLTGQHPWTNNTSLSRDLFLLTVYFRFETGFYILKLLSITSSFRISFITFFLRFLWSTEIIFSRRREKTYHFNSWSSILLTKFSTTSVIEPLHRCSISLSIRLEDYSTVVLKKVRM